MTRTAPTGGLVTGTAAVLAGSVAALAGSLGVRILMARVLDPDRLGVLSFAIAVVSSLGGVASLGLYAAATRRIAELRELEGEGPARVAARTAAVLAAAAGVAAALALGLGGPALARAWGAPRLAVLLPVMAPMVAVLSLGTAVWGISQGFGDVRGRALVRDAGGSLLRLAGVGAACVLGGGLVGVAAGFAAGSVVGELAFFAYALRLGWLGGDSGWDRSLLPQLPPYAGLGLLSQVRGWADVLLLGAFAAPAEVGVYSVARGLSQLANMIWQSAMHRFLPIASAQAAAGDREGLARVCARTRRLIFALLWPVLAVCLLWPETLIAALFGPAYMKGGLALALLAAGFLLQVLWGYNESALVALDRAGALFRLGAAGTAVTVAGLVVLAPYLGAAGAAAAVLAGTVARAGPAWWLVRREMGPPEGLWRFARWSVGVSAPALLVALILGRAGVGGWTAMLLTGAAAAPPALWMVVPELLSSRRAAAPPS